MAPPLPSLMRAWQYSSTTPTLEANLELRDDVALPSLSSRLGDHEVLIEVISGSINPADHKVPELGIVGRAMIRTPASPGMDFCGRVVQATRTVDTFALGDIVYGRIDGTQHGTCAQYVAAPVKACALLPDGVDPDQAASLGVAGMTEYDVIVPNVKAGDKVFINGGSGGTGTFGIQIAKAVGCHVTVTCSPAKAELCRSLGADEIIDYTAVNLCETLKAKGLVYSLVVDNAGTPGELYKAADDFLLPEGRFVQVGGAITMETAKVLASRLMLPSFMGGGKRKFEFFMIKHNRQGLEQLGRWVAEGKVKPVIDEVYEFEDLPKAFAKLREGKNRGKLVIHVGKK